MFSPENYPASTHILRLEEILIGKGFLPYKGPGRMSRVEHAAAKDFIQDSFRWVRPADSRFSLEKILEGFAYLNAVYGINAAAIDPWNKLEHHMQRGDSETLYIGRRLDQIQEFGRNHGIHMFVVAHPTKMKRIKDSNLYEVPTAYDISGSSNWYNKADNILSVYRKYTENMSSSHTVVYVQKIKHSYYGKIGFAEFDFEKTNQRYTPRSDYADAKPLIEIPQMNTVTHNNAMQPASGPSMLVMANGWTPTYADDEQPF
jgi:twinkle protein